jgi:hypothetical protein
VPELWIRQVMRQESGGQEQVVSSAGAIGLMQIMPGTYDDLRQRYGLGDDPFEPHDNIKAGSAYIREMYDRYGAPGFLAAYNAGPNRLDSYLSSGDALPDETVNYVASIAPRLGSSVPMTGPLAAYGAANVVPDPAVPVGQVAAPVAVASGAVAACDQNAAYDPDRPCAPVATPPVVMTAAAPMAGGCDPDAAYDPIRPCPRGVVTASLDMPVTTVSRSLLYQPAAPVASMAPPAASPSRAVMPAAASDAGWSIQVGAFSSPVAARAAATGAYNALPDLLATAQIDLLPTTPFGGAVVYRARLGNLPADAARAACARLAAAQLPCIIIAGPGERP